MAAFSTIAAVVGAAATVASVVQAQKASSDQRKAQKRAEQRAQADATEADRAFNKANQKTPDLASIIAGNRAAANGGVGSTLLTGASGVSKDSLSLGRKTLLGG